MPPGPVSTMFKHLENFVTQMLEEDAHFTIFPHDDLPKTIDVLDILLDDVDDWLQYFPQAWLHTQGGDTYIDADWDEQTISKIHEELCPLA